MPVGSISVSANYDLLKKALDASSLRGEIIAQNLSNINTPNYKKYTVSFEDSLANEKKVSMKSTKIKHYSDGIVQQGDIRIVQDNSTSMREDGNNVDLDLEKVNQAANSLMYNALITEANSRLTSTRYVITGGK
ncbi:MAG: flagellar basal body rod protein FlgB [Clostridiaceae bacterium]